MPDPLNKNYPLFIPPGAEGLVGRRMREWSRKEADEYAAWFHSVMPQRIEDLIRYFGMDPNASRISLLEPLGLRVADALLAGDPFSKDGRLTNTGHAVALDMGLLQAAALLERHPDLKWGLLRKPKSDVSYNRPVLWIGKQDFDPLLIGTTPAFGILDGSKSGENWRRAFDVWSDKVEPG